jgi:type I restriction enzyme R subunit
VDRRALAAQAVREFATFEAESGRKFPDIYEVFSQRFHHGDLEDSAYDPRVLPTSYLEKPGPGHAFVYVCTIQRMAMNLFGRDAVIGSVEEAIDEDDAERINIPIHAFDVVIADECHRGYTAAESSVWSNTLDHFDAVTIGLTATPAAHTTAYFKDVVFRYEYERAVREGYLVDYDLVAVRSEVRIKGIFLKEGEEVGMVDTSTGAQQLDLLEDEREIEAPDVERKGTSPDSNRKILEEVKKYGVEHEARYGRFPKTLIFALHDEPHKSHADQLVDIARDVFGKGNDFVQKITGKVDRPLQRIREFRNRKEPDVVVTVDLLTTGIDIKDLEYLVFLRPVKSRILFEQMLGRGTRGGDWYAPDKSHFTVFDCFNGTLFEYFRQATAITAEPPDKPSRSVDELIEDIWHNRDREYNVRCLVKRLQRIDKEMSGEAREMFAAQVLNGDLGRLARELPDLLNRDFTGTMSLLRDAGFRDLLKNYPRKRDQFIVAYGAEDVVDSEILIGEHKPKDYLEAFERFVRENPEHVEAIEILLDRPKDWSTDALEELRKKLVSTRERFTLDRLRKVHAVRYHKPLVDIISMVKHAAHEEEPLLTAEERVFRAWDRLTAGKYFTEMQKQWLERIRGHMIENLSIARKDFDDIPVSAASVAGARPTERSMGSWTACSRNSTRR